MLGRSVLPLAVKNSAEFLQADNSKTILRQASRFVQARRAVNHSSKKILASDFFQESDFSMLSFITKPDEMEF